MKLRFLICFLLIPLAIQAASFTVSKSLTGSSGSFTSAGFTDPPFNYSMTNNIVAGFSANIGTTTVQLANGGLTNQFCGSFICKNTALTQTVYTLNLFLDSGGTKTVAVIQASHSVCIDGAPSSLWINSSTNFTLASWAFCDF